MTEYRIATSVLEDIVRGSLAADDRIRVHAPLPLTRTHPVEVLVAGDRCEVVIQLDARLGEVLPALAADVRSVVAGAHRRHKGHGVESVKVVFASVFPAGT
jgi:anti-sigma factor RsiW